MNYIGIRLNLWMCSMPCSSRDYQFLTDQIIAVEDQIKKLNEAQIALEGGGIQSYTIDTGQSKQTVTKYDLDSIEGQIDRLYNRRETLYARRDGCGTHTARPSF